MGFYLNKNYPVEDIYTKLALRPTPRKKYSKYRGVGRSRNPKKPFTANITFQGKRYYLGNFPTELEAARAYNKNAVRIIGEFAILNELPDDTTSETGAPYAHERVDGDVPG